MTTNTTVTPATKPTRIYGYVNNNADNKFLDKGAKLHGSKAKFLNAMITTARKSKLVIAVPKTTKAKKTSSRVIQ